MMVVFCVVLSLILYHKDNAKTLLHRDMVGAVVQAYTREERKILVINLKFVAEKFARMKKMPYLCNRYNTHTSYYPLFNGNRAFPPNNR